jgi:predicted nucleic acid-binding protein
MTRRYGIDTSVLVRLLTGQPPETYVYCERQLTTLVESGTQVCASNQVIGEAYIAVQHHYDVSADNAVSGLLDVLQSGLVAPLGGLQVIAALQETRGAGLFDRLITDDYSQAGLETLTLDRKMAALPDVRRL